MSALDEKWIDKWRSTINQWRQGGHVARNYQNWLDGAEGRALLNDAKRPAAQVLLLEQLDRAPHHRVGGRAGVGH